MILSIVIVNYNVKFFLEQCLSSIQKAAINALPGKDMFEVFIIDNASADHSGLFITKNFPSFHYIQNHENLGFSRANNHGLKLCTGDYVLFLNPDTILAEDSLKICLSFFSLNPNAGAVGPKMLDGTGSYLKESKRGFPSPTTSFFKMTGLAHLFPRSKFFASYYMGHLDENSTQQVEILSGAFMMVRKTVLDKIGGFDEQFFMYAEDIDLSHRIRQSGFQNYYLPSVAIIHFKGESTPKDKQYVNTFYSAMDLFLKKHFYKKPFDYRSVFLKSGIRLRKMLAHAGRKKTISKQPVSMRTYISGSKEDLLIWKEVKGKNFSIADSLEDADEVIYCEGPELSWKWIISEISSQPARFLYKFHGLGTHAAVGSHSSRDQGEIYVINQE